MVSTRISGNNLKKARKLLIDVTKYLDSLGIEYHLEGGTLLGFVRDGEFLEWDHDIDLSIAVKDIDILYSKRKKLWLKGYRIKRRKSTIDLGPIHKGEYRIFKVKRILGSFLSMFSKRLRNMQLVADIFVKFDDGRDSFWIAKEVVMKVPNLHYHGHEEISYNGNSYKVPVEYRDYLTRKYGDWSITVKNWDCASDEKSAVAKVS